MKIHEYQAKELLKKFSVPVQDGFAIKHLDEFEKAIQQLKSQGINQYVVKSQIHAGGRGKGKVYNPENRNEVILEGGVKFTTSVEKAREYAEKILGNLLVTHQTGSEGKIVKTLFIAEGLDYVKEFYLGILLDRTVSQNVIMASTEGGVEIEKVAAETPEKIIKVWVDPAIGLQPFQTRELAFALGLSGDNFKNFQKFIKQLYAAYEATDASLLEINPLVITNDNRIVALDGNVGCMVNGAGLAMGTMDIIKLAGGEPANFLDVGGGANKETVANGFKIILSDPNVKAILINIFGGIVRCDRVAAGVIEATKTVNVTIPIVVRLEGTNAKEAGVLLKESGLNFEVATTLKDAAEKVTAILKK